MFASRTQWNLAPNSLSLHLAARRRAGLPILDLTESNPTRCGFEYPRELIMALAQPPSLLYEPQPKGQRAAREAIAGYYAQRQVSIDPEHLVLTASTSEAYAFLFRLLAEPGDNVLAPRPSYPLFDFLATLNDVDLKPYSLVYQDGWHIDSEMLWLAVDARTRAILIVHPNNPTGSFLQRADFTALTELAQRHKLALIADEVFSDYAFAADRERVESLAETREVLTFTLNGLSKMVGLPQMKLAWIAASGPENLRKEAMERLEIIADTYLSVNTPVQVALPQWLEGRSVMQKQIRERVQSNRQFLLEQSSRSKLARCLKAEGGWYAVMRIPRTRSEEDWILDLLDRDGVLLHPGYFFDFPAEGYLVVSLLPPPPVFETAVTRLLARIEAA